MRAVQLFGKLLGLINAALAMSVMTTTTHATEPAKPTTVTPWPCTVVKLRQVAN